MDREEILELLKSEYAYWRSREDTDPQTPELSLVIAGALGALSNAISAVVANQWLSTQKEGLSYLKSYKHPPPQPKESP